MCNGCRKASAAFSSFQARDEDACAVGEQVRDRLAGGSEHAPLQARVAAALMTSAAGILAANPSDVVKVRMQASRVELLGS